jgi:hypothetical protein
MRTQDWRRRPSRVASEIVEAWRQNGYRTDADPPDRGRRGDRVGTGGKQRSFRRRR